MNNSKKSIFFKYGLYTYLHGIIFPSMKIIIDLKFTFNLISKYFYILDYKDLNIIRSSITKKE